MSLVTQWKRIFLICVCGWHKIGWKETKSWYVESTQQRSWFGRTFPRSCTLGLHSTTMWSEPKYCGQLQNHVWIANFCGGIGKITIPSKSSFFFMVLWHGWSCEEVCGTILRVSKQDDSLTLQSIYSMHRWPPLQRRRRDKICWRIVKHLLSNCSEMLIFGTYWRFDILWSVNKLARSITKWTEAYDKRLHRLISYIHHTCEYKQYCHVGNTAKQCRLGPFQDSDFAGDLEDSKPTSGGTLCVFGSHTYVCSNKLDVQETNISFSQFNRIWNHLSGHGTETGWWNFGI